MKYLIDTNICIYLMNQHPHELILRFKKLPVGSVGVSSITVSELQFGVAKSKRIIENQQRLTEFLLPFGILSYGVTETKIYGQIRAKLESIGKLIGPLDMLIAAHAKSLNLVLVTNNDKEFNRVEGLKVQNWLRTQ